MAYSTVEVAAALGIEVKRLDNLLAREAKHLIATGTRGRSRQVGDSVVEVLAIGLLLRRDMGVPLGRAIGIADGIAASRTGEILIGALATLRFDLTALRRVIRQALADAVEDSPRVRRGRPPRKAKRGASI